MRGTQTSRPETFLLKFLSSIRICITLDVNWLTLPLINEPLVMVWLFITDTIPRMGLQGDVGLHDRNKCSDRSISRPFRKIRQTDRQTNQPTNSPINRRTSGLIGKLDKQQSTWCGSRVEGHFILGRTETIFSVSAIFLPIEALS